MGWDLLMMGVATSFALFVLNGRALLSIVNADAGRPRTLCWSLAVMLLPLAGFALWLAIGPRPTA